MFEIINLTFWILMIYNLYKYYNKNFVKSQIIFFIYLKISFNFL